MISGVLTLTAIADAEFTRLHLSTDTIVVDPYNVQTEPLKIKVEQVSGVDIMPVSVYLSVQALSLNHEIAGALTDFGLCSEAEYVIPAKDKLYATVTAVRVDAYSDIEKKKLVESRTVNVTCNREAEPMYRGDKWTADMSFRNGDYLEHVVNGNTSIYQWSSRVEGNTSKAPWDITLTTDPEYGYWLHITEKTLFAAKMLLAKGALIGSAVFDGDYTISQHGVDENGQPSTRYDLFGEKTADGRDIFTPNIMIDWLTGKMKGKDVDIEGKIKGKDVVLTGEVNADSGRIGGFKIENNELHSGNFNSVHVNINSNGISSGFRNSYAEVGPSTNEVNKPLTLGRYILFPSVGDYNDDLPSDTSAAIECSGSAELTDSSYAIWARGCSSFGGIRPRALFINGSDVIITRNLSCIAIHNDVTIVADNSLRSGHVLKVVNLAETSRKLYGNVYNKTAMSTTIGGQCSKSLVCFDGMFYPESDISFG